MTSPIYDIADLLASLPQAGDLLPLAETGCEGAILHGSSTTAHRHISHNHLAECQVATTVYAPGRGSRRPHESDIVLLRSRVKSDNCDIESTAALTAQQAREIAAQLLIAAAVAEQSIIAQATGGEATPLPEQPPKLLPDALPRALAGRIVDEVFGGAIEDASVIEDIYRVIAQYANARWSEA